MTSSNKDEPAVDNSTEEAQARSIVDRARAQAAKIIQSANMQAKQILETARAEGNMIADPPKEAPRKWYYNSDGEGEIFEIGKQPEGWYDSPDVAKNPPKKSKKKAA